MLTTQKKNKQGYTTNYCGITIFVLSKNYRKKKGLKFQIFLSIKFNKTNRILYESS